LQLIVSSGFRLIIPGILLVIVLSLVHTFLSVPIQYRGGFDVIPGDEIKTQTQSYAVQPCKVYFRWTGNRRSGGDGSGGGRRLDRKKE